MFTIGEFSRITQLSVKALRLYHEREILIPSKIDEWNNYRYYDQANVQKAHVIKYLRDMQFGLDDIQELLKENNSDWEVIDFVKNHQENAPAD